MYLLVISERQSPAESREPGGKGGVQVHGPPGGMPIVNDSTTTVVVLDLRGHPVRVGPRKENILLAHLLIGHFLL